MIQLLPYLLYLSVVLMIPHRNHHVLFRPLLVGTHSPNCPLLDAYPKFTVRPVSSQPWTELSKGTKAGPAKPHGQGHGYRRSQELQPSCSQSLTPHFPALCPNTLTMPVANHCSGLWEDCPSRLSQPYSLISSLGLSWAPP